MRRTRARTIIAFTTIAAGPEPVLQRISMHRDVSATACPGRNGVNWVQNPGGLRDLAAEAIADS